MHKDAFACNTTFTVTVVDELEIPVNNADMFVTFHDYLGELVEEEGAPCLELLGGGVYQTIVAGLNSEVVTLQLHLRSHEPVDPDVADFTVGEVDFCIINTFAPWIVGDEL